MSSSTAPHEMETKAPNESAETAVSFRRTVTIRRTADELYAFWRDLPNLPRFMRHLKSVTLTGPGTSHWVAKAPGGQDISWDARIIDEVPGERIAWESLPDSQVENAGSVVFRESPSLRGTEVTVDLSYAPPAGTVGKVIARLFGEEPQQQVADDLLRFQALMETGEIPTTEGQSSGRRKKEVA